MTASTASEDGRFEGRAMGSPLRLTLGRSPGADPVDGSRAWQAVMASFEASEQAMSRFRDSSELTGLNRLAGTGAVTHVSPALRRALAASDRAHRLTHGRFDPRVLADLERLGYTGAALPDDGRPTRTGSDRSATTAGRVMGRVGRDGVCLEQPADLGGIGKGLGLRWAGARLDRDGVPDYLLEAGGDLLTRGLDPAGDPWLIGLEDPTEGRDHLAVIAVVDGAVATSSIRVHRWTVDGRDVHHLVDPRTGEPATGGLLSVTVAGPDPAWAEVWSKVLFVGGRDGIAADARARGLAAWWIADDGSMEMTADARRRTVWVAAEDDPAG
jgi:thiamine biosynthesis lipoprotein